MLCNTESGLEACARGTRMIGRAECCRRAREGGNESEEHREWSEGQVIRKTRVRKDDHRARNVHVKNACELSRSKDESTGKGTKRMKTKLARI